MVWGLRLPNACPPFSQAGLGRTGTLIALYLMKHHSFTALEAMGWLRLVRPGSVIGPQQHFLVERESAMHRAGELFCSRGPKEVLPHDAPSAAIADFVRRSFPRVDSFIKHLTESPGPAPVNLDPLDSCATHPDGTPAPPAQSTTPDWRQSLKARRALTLAEHVTTAAGHRSIERRIDPPPAGGVSFGSLPSIILASLPGEGDDGAGSDLALASSDSDGSRPRAQSDFIGMASPPLEYEPQVVASPLC